MERAAKRARLYEEVADTVVDVDGRTVGEVVAAIRGATPA